MLIARVTLVQVSSQQRSGDKSTLLVVKENPKTNIKLQFYLVNAKCVDTLGVFVQNFHRLYICHKILVVKLGWERTAKIWLEKIEMKKRGKGWAIEYLLVAQLRSSPLWRQSLQCFHSFQTDLSKTEKSKFEYSKFKNSFTFPNRETEGMNRLRRTRESKLVRIPLAPLPCHF